MPVPRRRLAWLDRAEWLAPTIALGVRQAIPADLRDEALAQRVDHAGADAVESARDLVRVVIELPPRVERGEDHFEGALAGLGVDVHGNAPAVVGDGQGLAVGLHRDNDPRGVAVHDLVHGVIDDLPEQMMQARLINTSDIHAGPAADGLQTLQDGDRVGVICSGCHYSHSFERP